MYINDPLISLIIPVYNAEKSINRCLESVLSQSFDKYEVILVNDGSSDNSPSICEYYKKKSNCISVFHQKNKGVSAARNYGIEKARGEWIAFMDSDDSIEINYLEQLYAGIPDQKNCMVFQGLKYIDTEGSEIKLLDFEEKVFYKSDFSTLLEDLYIYNYGFPFAKLYSKHLLDSNSIRFNINISSSEDMLFMFEYLEVCSCVSMISGYQYNYYQANSGTLSTRLNSFDSEYAMFNQLSTIVNVNRNNWHITDNSSLNWVVTRFLYRAILAIYKQNRHLQKEKKISLLYSIANIDIEYIKKYKSPILLLRLIRRLLLARQTKLLDFILRLI